MFTTGPFLDAEVAYRQQRLRRDGASTAVAHRDAGTRRPWWRALLAAWRPAPDPYHRPRADRAATS